MTKFYEPVHCPNCGGIDLNGIDNPLAMSGDTLYYKHSLTVKWAECNVCGEIFPLSRAVKELPQP